MKLFVAFVCLMSLNAFAGKILNCASDDIRSDDAVFVEITQNSNGTAAMEITDGNSSTIWGVMARGPVDNIAKGEPDNLIGENQQSIRANNGKSVIDGVFFRATGKDLKTGFLAINGNVHILGCVRLIQH